MRYKCPCCENYTLREDSDDICSVCAWQDDVLQREDQDYIGGPNSVSLNQARENYNAFRASNRKFIDKVRKPLLEELPENNM